MHTDYGYSEEKALGKPYDAHLLRQLVTFAMPHKRLLFCSVFFVIIISILDLALPLVTKTAIDHYIVPAAGLNLPNAGKTAVRYLQIDLKNPAHNNIVKQHNNLFQRSGATARIPLSDLSRLPQKALKTLRISDLNGIGLMALIFMGVVILNFGLNFGQVMVMELAGQKIMHDLRLRLFTHIQRLAVSFFTHNPVGRLVTRITNDVQNMQDLFTSIIAVLFKDFFLLTGITVILVMLNWQLALITFSVLPLVVLASIHFAGRSRRVFRTLRIKVAEINTRFSETIGGINVIQTFLREKHNHALFEDLNHANYLAGMKQIHVFAVFMPMVEVLATSTLALVIYFGGGRVVSAHLSLGELVAFISYIRMFFRPIRDVAEKYNIMQNAMASAERLFLILDSREKLESPTPAATKRFPEKDPLKTIKFDNVGFEYLPQEPVLKNISAEISAGETVALVGSTGSGKTTLLNLLIRLYDPLKGHIEVNGRNLRDWDINRWRAKTALVTQDPFLFSESLRYNILLGRKNSSTQNLEDILSAANCRELVDKLPQGLDTVLTENGRSLSSGQRQLISIARAIASHPELIILDEATSYIDSQTEQQIQKALSNLLKGKTAIMAAHRLSTARWSDRIMVLKRGRIIENGTHDELMQQQGFYFDLVRLKNK